MEEKKNIMPLHGNQEPAKEELKAQLMQAQQTIAAMRMDFQKKLEQMNYANAFQQQH